MNSHCMICKIPLTDYTSVKIGMGPVCRARYSIQGDLLFESHAVFNILKETETFILIKDIGHQKHKTVTNDVEYVLKQLAEVLGIDGKRIFYIDSSNELDEIVHNGTNFLYFQHGHQGIEI